MRPFSIFSTLALLSTASFGAMSGAVANGNITIPQVSGKVTIDGKLEESLWSKASQVSVNTVVSPDENIKSPVDTTAYIMADESTLYIAFKALDPNPENIRAFFRQRDNIFADDIVGVKLDTYNDGNKAYQFFVNPYGVQSDSIENELVGRENRAWNAIWDAAGDINAQGYIVEMAVPLSVFNFEEKAQAQHWGIELVRFLPRETHQRISNTIKDRQISCTLCQMAVAQGLAGAKQSTKLQLIPTVTASRNETRDINPTTPWQSENNSDAGLDIKWGITPDVSLYTTINPDFSQIESDSGQLNVNNTFALFNRERRGFFLDNADVFDMPFMNLFYTRNVSAPKVGTKLTGRLGNHTFGVFAAQDKDTYLLLPGTKSSGLVDLDRESNSAVARYRYDQGNKFSMGALLTAREADDYSNTVLASDVKYRPTDNDTLRMQLTTTRTQYPHKMLEQFELSGEAAVRANTDDTLTGNAISVQYRHNQREWNARAAYHRKSGGFRADLGWVGQIDADQLVIGGERTWFLQDQWLNKIQFGGDWDISHNNNGELLERESEAYIKFRGESQSHFRVSGFTRDKVGSLALDNDNNPDNDIDYSALTVHDLGIDENTTLFTEKGLWAWGKFTPIAGLTLELFTEKADSIVYANNELGESFTLKPEVFWNINDHMQLNITHRYTTMDVDAGDLFKANLTDLRFTYHFNIRSSLRFSAVYKDIARNQANYRFDDVDAQYKNLGTQLLYSYKINPQTLVYLGYSDNGSQYDGLDRLTKDQRSVFAKFSYAWLN